jgi:hypothetical protein
VTGGGAGRHGPAGPAAAAVLGRRVDGRRLAAMVELEGEAVVAALDLPLATVVGHVLDLTAGVSPSCSHWTRPGGTVVTRIG